MKQAHHAINPDLKNVGSTASSISLAVLPMVVGALLHFCFSLLKDAGRAWGLACILVFFFFSTVVPALAVPPGTLIANTAQATFRSWGNPTTSTSETVTLVTGRLNTPASIELLQYAPSFPGADPVSVPVTEYSDTGTTTSSVSIASLYPAGSTTPIDMSGPVPLISASVYHQGEPVFLRVSDQDQNLYPGLVETIWVLVTVPGTAESELLLLTETGSNSGVFAGYIQSGNRGAGTEDDFNGLLDVREGLQIEARYTDSADAGDTVVTAALVDPFGVVFDSATGLPVDNVQITLVEDATGSPATVYGDDGVSTFPATIVTGGTFVDGSGKVYAFSSGNYRFPFVTPGAYRLTVSPPPGYGAPSTVPTPVLQALPNAPFAIADPGSRGETFVLNPGPAIRMDIPVDPTSLGLWLQKSAHRQTASVGDFVQYTVTVENQSGGSVSDVRVVDQLPLGFRYRQGSARLDGNLLGDPQISSNGRTLTFSIGAIAADGSTQVRYVTEISAGAKPGRADNRAAGNASGGLTSNAAVATITVTEDLFRSKNIIAGRVVADNCSDDPTAASDGIPGVRIYLEGGTFVITDEKGRYHFEGVASGTHVVQLDLATLPSRYEMALCDGDSRGAGTLFSRFVELHGGTLWRADFHARTKTPPSGAVRLGLESKLQPTGVRYRADIEVRQIAVDNMRLTVILPEGSAYVPGSSRRVARVLSDPQLMGNVLIYRLGDAAPAHAGTLEFDVRLNPVGIKPGELRTRAMMTFNTPERLNQRTPMIDTALALNRHKVHKVQPPMAVRPHFDILSAELTPQDRQMLDRLVEKLTSRQIEHVVCIGHTDNRLIRPGQGHPFADNQELSVARARNVADYLAHRLHITDRQMTIAGKGLDQPLATNATEQGRARNRRVEVKVMSVKVESVDTLSAVKAQDKVVSPTRGVLQTASHTAVDDESETPSVQGVDDIDIDALSPGLDWLLPAKGDTPHIPSIKLAVQHLPQEKITLLLNNAPVSALNFDGQKLNKSRTVAVSYWRGVDLRDGDNHFTAVCKDRNGKETRRIERMVHLAGPAIHLEYLKEKSRLIANGRDVPTVALRLTDKDGHPARFGTFGNYEILPPYQADLPKKSIGEDQLTRIDGEQPRFTIGNDGMAYIKLAPTTQAGYATVTIPLSNKDHDVRVWLEPELREWILVGLAEGTVGYNTVSGNLETLKANHREADFYQDGRVAFFAKGKVKGKWLVTAAYDSGREIKEIDTGLFQTIDPDTYYTLYGDAAQQQNEAPSIRKLYFKIEREQFYALFGDFDTGLSVTELSRYSRRFNGVKSEYVGQRWGLGAFATDTDQAFIKDEIRGNGTSGLYRLSRQNIVPNSETVTIETRDRFRSELILSSQTLSRHIDYNIDTHAGTLFFKSPVYSRDENFNPTYIVIEYESGDASEQAYTYGGRASVKLADGKVALGATYIHEGPRNAEGDLGGLDAHLDLGNGLEAKAEVASTRKDDAGAKIDGQAYLVQVSKHSASQDSTIYFREQGKGFGLGQQNGSEEATRKIGADADWRINALWSLSGELYRQYNLATDAQRDLAEARVAFHQPLYHLYSGFRMAQDQWDNTDTHNSTQLLLGGSRRFLDNRLQTRISHEHSLLGNNESMDFPTRTTVGADYKVVDPVTLFAEHEVAQAESETSQSSRMGIKATPWHGSQVGSSVGRAYNENGQRLFANLGLTQSWRINDRWRVDGGLDRTQTVHSNAAPAPFNTNVPTAAGAQKDFTAITLGAGYRADQWSWTGRVESRTAASEDKWGVISGIAGEVRSGLGLSAGMDIFSTMTKAGTDALDAKVRLSLAYRPKNTRWIVLDRLDYKFENRKDAAGSYEARRIVNNFNANYKPHHKLQVAFQYGAKYVFDTIDNRSYTGYTDLTGLEARYDLARRWDLGLHAGLLHSWNAGQLDYRTGCSVGYAVMKNMWVSLGYNFTGYTDEDFSAADHTAAGPFMKMRMKFDQQSVKEMVGWFAAKK